jgi:hypothetical protein
VRAGGPPGPGQPQKTSPGGRAGLAHHATNDCPVYVTCVPKPEDARESHDPDGNDHFPSFCLYAPCPLRAHSPPLSPPVTRPRSSSVRHDDVLRAASERMKLGLLPHEKIPMAVKPQDIWYVSFEQKRIRPAKRAFSRATETFRTELKAKEFAKQKLAETKNVSAGTLNPHLPKRVISSAQMIRWLEEPTGTDAVP